jgi:hypothetical protein
MTNPGTALTQSGLSADARKALLKNQQSSITTDVQLPIIKIMGAGAGMYEFPDEDRPTPEFRGILLGGHPRNVLWTKKMAVDAVVEGEEGKPECSSRDGKYGVPKVGFRHAALGGRAATEDDRIACAECPYNKFGTGNLFIPDKNKKGKAVSNEKMLYVLLADRMLPFQLKLSVMSISNYDDYVQRLTNKGLTTLEVETVFRQQKHEKGSVKYATATFTQGGPVTPEAFNYAYEMYRAYEHKINPQPEPPKGAVEPEGDDIPDAEFEDFPGAMAKSTDDIPF